MNWIESGPIGKPVSQEILSRKITHLPPGGWIGARVQSYRMREKLLAELFALSAARVKRMLG